MLDQMLLSCTQRRTASWFVLNQEAVIMSPAAKRD